MWIQLRFSRLGMAQQVKHLLQKHEDLIQIPMCKETSMAAETNNPSLGAEETGRSRRFGSQHPRTVSNCQLL